MSVKKSVSSGLGLRGALRVLLLACFLCASAPAAELPPAQVAAAAQYSTAHRGLSLLVLQHGKVLAEDYPNGGSASSAHKIYSGTKGFWMLAALRAAEEGILDLDERVAETLPEWKADPGKSRITLRELLTFSSGIDAENRLHGDGFADRDAIALRVPQVAPAGRAFIYGPAPLQIFHALFTRKLASRGETPTQYLERKILHPLGLGSQRYLADQRGQPVLATGFLLTARQWSRLGEVLVHEGAPLVSDASLAQCLRGSPVNPAFAFGFWNNHFARHPAAREFDIEDMLTPKWPRQNWRGTCLCRDAPPDLLASIGSGYQRLFVIPSLGLVVVRQGIDAKFSDAKFLRLLLGK